MWSKNHRSLLMLIRIRHRGKWGFVIPVPFLVLDITLNALSDLAWLGDFFFPLWRRDGLKNAARGKWSKAFGHLIRPGDAVRMLLALFDELRKYGSWRMVEVEAGPVRVYIDFY